MPQLSSETLFTREHHFLYQVKSLKTMAFRVNAKSDNPEVSRTFLWIQFSVAFGLNAMFLLAFMLYKYNPDFHSFITGRP